MTILRACLFQTLRVFSAEGCPIDLGSPTNRSLIAYLLLYRANRIDRRRLAFLFWPQASESAARRNLRQYIHRIRRTLERVDCGGNLILAGDFDVQINPRAEIWLDVDAFRENTRPDANLDELRAAVDLYQGDLLEDVYEDWCLETRRELRQTYLHLLDRLAQGLQAQNHLDEALVYAQKWVDEEPLDETAHRRFLSLLALTGDRNRAILHYKALKESLAQELHTEPMPETQAVYRSILNALSERAKAPIITPPLLRPSLSQPPPLPLVGRQPELSLLQSALQRSQDGQGRFILITGESGIGKTRLVQDFVSNNSDLPTLYGVCHELELIAPYAALRQALLRALDILPNAAMDPPQPWMFTLAQFLPSLARRFPFLAIKDVAPGESPGIMEALANLVLTLCAHSSGTPLLLILDDLHWGDGPTWDFLAMISRYAETQPLLIIGLCRIEDLPHERNRLIRALERNRLLLHLPLKRLSPEETAELASHLLPEEPVDALFITRLYRETEGNPFFVIETLRAMREAGHPPSLTVDRSGRIQTFSLPLSVQRVIEARLDRLSVESQELLATAAAIGRAFTFSLLTEIGQTSAEEAVQHIEEWLRRGLVREAANAYDFSHDKIRQVVYAGLSRARRQYIHHKIGEVFESAVPPADPATLAYHFARSDLPLKALPYLTKAGEQALQVRSYREARQFGLRAVSLLGRLPGPRLRSERVELNLQLAQAYAFTGDLPRALEILSETEHLALSLNDQEHLGEIFRRLSQIFWLRGQPEVAGEYARRALRAAEEQGKPVLVQAALRMMGRVGIALSAFDDAIAYLQRYTRLEDQVPRPPDLAIISGYLGIAYARVGSWRRALEAAQRGLALAEAEGSSQAIDFARMQLGFIHAEHYNWRECLQILDPIPNPLEVEPDPTADARHRSAESKPALTPFGFMLLGLRGRALAYVGQPEQAVELIKPALAWIEKSDYRVFHYLPRMFLAEASNIAHQPPLAVVEAKRALAEAREAGNRWAAGITLRILAECYSRLPEPDWTLIEDHLIESMNILRQVRARPDLARTYLALRRLYDRAGQIAWAVDCHFRATTIFEELGMHEEFRQAQGQAAGERKGAVVIPDMRLRGPNPY